MIAKYSSKKISAQNVSAKIGNKIEKRKGNSLGHGLFKKSTLAF